MSDKTDDATDGAYPACQISMTNPAGMMLVLRGPDVPDLVDQINDLWDGHVQGHVKPREELTNLLLQSFNPAVIADMQDGRTAEQALGYEPDELATAAYNALAAGAKRTPIGTASTNGAGGGGRTAQKTFKAPEIGDRLPSDFREELTRSDLCPKCKDPEGLFYDNRGNDKGLPTFKCANADCTGSQNGKYAWGWYDPSESSDRGRRGSARTR